ncbi:MAG: hypothetical protein PHP03_02170 [Candidatus Pacebacteria bacterium]|nr:hypothetical protein [Candidatus Paceibacterota bacterium]
MDINLSKLNETVNNFSNRSVGTTPGPVFASQASSAIDEYSKQLNVSKDDANKIVAYQTYTQIRNQGGDAGEFYKNAPAELQGILKYAPDDLKFNQTITSIKTFGSPVAILGAVGAAALGLITWPVAIPLAVAGTFWWLNGLANDWNDVNHWGPLMMDQRNIEFYKMAQNLDDIGVTDYGKFTQNEIDTIVDGMQRAGYRSITDQIAFASRPVNYDGVYASLKSIVSNLNASGMVPTKKQVLVVLKSWSDAPVSISTKTPATTLATTSEGSPTSTYLPKMTQSIVSKPKLFLGTVLAGKVQESQEFVRKLDDKITDEQDLINDAVTNMTLWAAALPGRISYDIQIRSNPVDFEGIPHIGIWAVLVLYMDNQFHKRLLLDEILLGPMDPVVYYPETMRTKSITMEISKQLAVENIKPTNLGGGNMLTVDNTGNVVPLFQGNTPAYNPPAKMTQLASAGIPDVPFTTKPIGSTSKVYSLDASMFIDGNGFDGYVYKIKDGKKYQIIPSDTLYTNDQRAKMGNFGAQFGQAKIDLFKMGIDIDKIRKESHMNDSIWLAPWGQPQLGFDEFFNASQGNVTSVKGKFKVTVTADVLNVRSQPNSAAPLAGSQKLYKGNTFIAVEALIGENVSGQPYWWKSELGNYVWSGGTDEGVSL